MMKVSFAAGESPTRTGIGIAATCLVLEAGRKVPLQPSFIVNQFAEIVPDATGST
jgi:hypothetical protein